VYRCAQRIENNFVPVITTVDTVTNGRFRSEINETVVHVYSVTAYGGTEVYLHSFLIFPRGGSCGKLRAFAALFLGEDTPVGILQEFGWARGRSQRVGNDVHELLYRPEPV
jgi:hypothetical protein